MTSKTHILFFQHTVNIGGASWALLQLVAELKSAYRISVGVPAVGPLTKELDAMGVNTLVRPALTTLGNLPNLAYRLHNTGWIRERLKWRRATEEAERICGEVRPDLVHLNTMSFFHLAIGVKRYAAIPVVLQVREHWFPSACGVRNSVRKLAFNNIDHVFAITRANAVQFAYPGSTTLVRDWPDFTGRDGRQTHGGRFGIPDNKLIFLVPGGRIRIKGTLHAIQAMRHVRSENTVLLVLGGRGEMDCSPLKRRLVDELSKIGLRGYSKRVEHAAKRAGDRVVLAPSTKNMEALLNESYTVISPFVEPHFSKPVIEAGALGKPVIASDFPEIREAVQDGKTGLLVPPGDERALARAIDRLSRAPTEAARMGAAGRERVAREFSKKQSMAAIVNTYEEMLSSNRAKRP